MDDLDDTYSGVCVCCGVHQIGRTDPSRPASYWTPDPMFLAIGDGMIGQRQRVRLVVNDDGIGHELPIPHPSLRIVAAERG